MTSRYDQDRMASRMIRLEEQIRQRPIRVPIRGGTAAAYITIQVGGGNTLSSGQTGITYNPNYNAAVGPYPSSAWNPNLSPVAMDPGLGWGFLYINGVLQQSQVLIWNQNAGTPYALLSGRTMHSPGTASLPVGGPTGQLLTFYLVDWG